VTHSRYLFTILAGGLLCASTGCKCGREFAEVHGAITQDGKPLDNVEVVFMPDPEQGNKGPRASAYTDSQGRFKLRCEKAERDGALLGMHRVCVFDIRAMTTPANILGNRPKGLLKLDTPNVKEKRTRVPPQYSNPALTPLRAEVKADQKIFNFNIPSTSRK
jgi:hypothetical protein